MIGTERLQRGDGVLDNRVVAFVELPAFLRGEGAGRVGHQRALLGTQLAHDLEQPLVGVAFDVQLEPGRHGSISSAKAARRCGGCAARRDVDARSAVGSGIVSDAREAQHIGHPGMPELRSSATLLS